MSEAGGAVRRRSDAPLRIAVLAHVRHPIRAPFAGGMEAHTWHLARGLAARGHQVTLVASGDSEAGVALQPSVEQHYERRLPWARHRGTARLDEHLQRVFERAWQLVARGDVDVVHNNAMHPLPLMRAAQSGLPMLTSLHVPPFERLRRAVDAHRTPAQRYTVTSRRQRSIWWPESVPDGVEVVHNGIDSAAWPWRAQDDGGLVWAGRIAPNKGTELAAETARRTGRRLSIAGPIEDRDYFQERVAPWLDRRVRYIGHLDGQALAELFGRSAALLFTPLWEEPFGLVAIEAMACGLPVACTDRGAMREVVGEAGAFATQETPSCLAKALEQALRIPRDIPRRRVERLFTIDRMLDGYEAQYRRCIAAARPRLSAVG